MKYSVVYIILLLLASPLFPQQSRLGRNVVEVSEYIASDQFLRNTAGADDFTKVDSIWAYTLRHAGGDLTDALAAMIFSTLTVNNATIVTPVLRLRLTIPLFSAADSTLRMKNLNLPRRFSADTPPGSGGDVDKLAHFFGSAYLSYNFFIFDLSYFIGLFVEVFEESFKVDSRADNRDVRFNMLGIEFGKALKDNPGAMPSSFFKKYSGYYEQSPDH